LIASYGYSPIAKGRWVEEEMQGLDEIQKKEVFEIWK
jgi:hypothetical protein